MRLIEKKWIWMIVVIVSIFGLALINVRYMIAFLWGMILMLYAAENFERRKKSRSRKT